MVLWISLWHAVFMINEDRNRVSSRAFLASDEFCGRLRIYFYLVALIVSGQLLWMIEHSVQVHEKGSMQSINSKSAQELGFTDEQVEKLESQWKIQEFRSLFESDA